MKLLIAVVASLILVLLIGCKAALQSQEVNKAPVIHKYPIRPDDGGWSDPAQDKPAGTFQKADPLPKKRFVPPPKIEDNSSTNSLQSNTQAGLIGAEINKVSDSITGMSSKIDAIETRLDSIAQGQAGLSNHIENVKTTLSAGHDVSYQNFSKEVLDAIRSSNYTLFAVVFAICGMFIGLQIVLQHKHIENVTRQIDIARGLIKGQ